MKYNTEQELFWKNKFGNDYIQRNKKSNRLVTIGKNLLINKVQISSALELGANIGLNLDALKTLFPGINTSGVEINEKAYKILKKKHNSFNQSILNLKINKKFDLVFSCGVLIHQDPKYLNQIYRSIYNLSNKYIYIDEYFNPTPVVLKYRKNINKLFKRDFAKEIWKKYPRLKLLNYGFHWKEDPKLKNSCDNSNWFLFKK